MYSHLVSYLGVFRELRFAAFSAKFTRRRRVQRRNPSEETRSDCRLTTIRRHNLLSRVASRWYRASTRSGVPGEDGGPLVFVPQTAFSFSSLSASGSTTRCLIERTIQPRAAVCGCGCSHYQSKRPQPQVTATRL